MDDEKYEVIKEEWFFSARSPTTEARDDSVNGAEENGSMEATTKSLRCGDVSGISILLSKWQLGDAGGVRELEKWLGGENI